LWLCSEKYEYNKLVIIDLHYLMMMMMILIIILSPLTNFFYIHISSIAISVLTL